MKRSDMQEIICTALYDINPEYYDGFTSYTRRLDADYILKEIEAAGMLPPLADFSVDNGDSVITRRDNKWENE